ncbi:GNAT family N-acetyltransferase [Estrella lausannensis]|uniref:Acetyltransferase n=1 Tax=Estrella lausannensis TaxID=483423 RepID=A0A0H5E8A8_9BACT|nr:GNAT family N-acetyltransferase [Estrella lausannensis]CRX39570.1 Acetyltransferase [Estrella lausannensis]
MDILTERLKIRTLTKDDLYKLAPILADEDIVRFSLTGPLKEEKEAMNYLQRIMDHHARFGFGLYAIEEQKSGSLIGLAGLLSQSIQGESKIELAYRLSQDFWGKGLGLEAASAIADHAFARLHINEIITMVDPRNQKGLAIAERLGMRPWKKTVLFDIPVSIYLLQKIEVVPYREEWARQFEEEKNKLSEAFKNVGIRFYHIGSTAIPGCFAKPIIDILGTVPDMTLLDATGNLSSALNYEALGEYGMRGRRFFTKRGTTAVNLHIFEESDPETERHLRFSKYLKENKEDRDSYSKLKLALAEKFPSNIQRYCLGKELAIKLIDIKAAEALSERISAPEAPLKKENWTPDEVLKALELNMLRQMTTFAKYVPNMEIVFQKDAVCLRSNINDDTFNIVLAANFPKAKAAHRVKLITDLYTSQKLPFSFWIGPSDKPADLDQHLKAAGLHLKEEDIGMAMPMDDFTKTQTPAGLTLKRCKNKEDLLEFCKVLESVNISPHAYQQIYSPLPEILYNGDSPFEMHTAAIEGKPIATGMLVLSANVAGIYYVAVHPEERRKGYGRAMMEHLLERAKERGYLMAVLLSSKEGKLLYENFGFKDLCLFKEYAWSPPRT